MHDIEIKEILDYSIPILLFKYVPQGGQASQIFNFSSLVRAIKSLNNINELKDYCTPLLENNIILENQYAETISIIQPEFDKIFFDISKLKIAAQILWDIKNKTKQYSENSILIKFPPVESFQDLSKISNDFKIAIEVPIHDANENLKIEKAEEGSIWITITTTFFGVSLIAKIVSAGFNIAKLNIQLKWHEEQSRTIGLKNDAIENILQMQKEFLKQKVQEETRSFLDEEVSPETFNRYKVSVEMMADLIDRGAEIIPGAIDDKELKKSFPKFKDVNLLADAIKKIEHST